MEYFFPSNLSYLRKSRGITQQQLADLSGVDRSSISRYENGDVEIPITQAMRLCDALGMPYAEMLGEDLRYQQLKAKTDALWDKYKDKLTDEDKKMIEFVIEKRIAELEREN